MREVGGEHWSYNTWVTVKGEMRRAHFSQCISLCTYIWPIMTKVGILTCGRGVFLRGQPCQGVGPKKIWDPVPTPIWHDTHNQMLHDDQTKWEKNFKGLTMTVALAKIFLTQMLIRYLFAVATHLVLPFVFRLLCSRPHRVGWGHYAVTAVVCLSVCLSHAWP